MLINEDERDAVYKTIYNRRDVRSDFKPDPIPEEVLMRILRAGHHAPSVGLMQPWDFIIVRDEAIRQQIKQGFDEANRAEAELFEGERKEAYKALKLEGIMDAPLGICVTCHRSRTGVTGLGRSANPNMDLYSAVCAVYTIWLAARAENIGLGWVSIIHHDVLKGILNIPEEIVPIAYLCMGYTHKFNDQPDLQEKGWRKRLPLESLIHFDQWQEKDSGLSES